MAHQASLPIAEAQQTALLELHSRILVNTDAVPRVKRSMATTETHDYLSLEIDTDEPTRVSDATAKFAYEVEVLMHLGGLSLAQIVEVIRQGAHPR